MSIYTDSFIYIIDVFESKICIDIGYKDLQYICYYGDDMRKKVGPNFKFDTYINNIKRR